MRKLQDYTVKELIDAYGDVVPDLNVDLSHSKALGLVLDYENDYYEENTQFTEENYTSVDNRPNDDDDHTIYDNHGYY